MEHDATAEGDTAQSLKRNSTGASLQSASGDTAQSYRNSTGASLQSASGDTAQSYRNSTGASLQSGTGDTAQSLYRNSTGVSLKSGTGESSGTETPASRLKTIWSSFVTCEPNSFSRSCWFENAIHEILQQLDDGISGTTILSYFSAKSNVVSLIGSEFLVDVHRVCSGSSEDDFGNLRKYLLQGRGAKCLAVLCALGVQEMSCAREFTSLLISLQSAISLDATESTDTPNISSSYENEPPCICCTLDSGLQGGEVKRKRSNESDTHRKKKSSTSGVRSRKLSSRTSSVRSNLFPGCSQPPLTQPANPGLPTNGDSTSSENEDNGVSGNGTAVKSQTLQITYNALDFDYFTSVIHSGDEERGEKRNVEEGERRQQFRISRVIEPYEKYRNVVLEARAYSCYEFKVLTLRILNTLASAAHIPADPSITSIQSHPLLHILKFSLDYLSTLQLSSHLHRTGGNPWKNSASHTGNGAKNLSNGVDEEKDARNGSNGSKTRCQSPRSFDDSTLRLKHRLCSLVFTCVRKIVTCREFAKYVIQYAGCLSTLIKIVEDVVGKIDNGRHARAVSEKLAKVMGGRSFGEETPRGKVERKGSVVTEQDLDEEVEKSFEELINKCEDINVQIDSLSKAVDSISKDIEPFSKYVDLIDETNFNGSDMKDSGVENTDNVNHVNSGEKFVEGIADESSGTNDSGGVDENSKTDQNVTTPETLEVKDVNKYAESVDELTKPNEPIRNVKSTNVNNFSELDEADAQGNTYLFNLTFTVLILYKHIIKYYSINEDKFNIFLQILNNFVNNKNINSVLKDKANKGKLVHELLLVKILRCLDNEHKMVVFNLLNELVANIQHVKLKLISSEKEKLNNALDNVRDSYHHVSMLGNSHSMLSNSKCIVSNLNFIVIYFLNSDSNSGATPNVRKVLGKTDSETVNCDNSDLIGARRDASQPQHGCEVRSGLGSSCCSRDKVIDVNHLNFHIIKLLLNNGACCCFPHKLLLNKIHALITSSENKKVTTYCFMLLESMLYKELNYYSDCAPCKYCDLVYVDSTLHEMGASSPSRGQEKSNGDLKTNKSNSSKNSNGEIKKSSKFTIASILSKKSSDKKIVNAKNTNVVSSGNATSTSTDDRGNLTVEDKRKGNMSTEVESKPCSSIDEELLINFYKSVINTDNYKLKAKLLAHLIKVVNAFKSSLQLELVEHVIQPLFLELKTRLTLSEFVCKEFSNLREKPKNEDLNEFIIVDSDCNIITSEKLDLCASQLEVTGDLEKQCGGDSREKASEVVSVGDFSGSTDISGTLEEKNPIVPLNGEVVPSNGEVLPPSGEAEGGDTQKKVKRRRSRRNSEPKQNLPQSFDESKKKLTRKGSQDKVTVAAPQPTVVHTSTPKTNKSGTESVSSGGERFVDAGDKFGSKTGSGSDSRNLNSNVEKALFKASIEQSLQTYDQTRKRSNESSNIMHNINEASKITNIEDARSGQGQAVKMPTEKSSVVGTKIEDFNDDALAYEQNTSLMLQVLTVLQSLTRQNKNVGRLLKKQNMLGALSEIILMASFTKLVCSVVESLLYTSYDKRKPVSQQTFEEFHTLLTNIRLTGSKLLAIINNTDDNLMNTIIFQTKSEQNVYLYCLSLLNSLIKCVTSLVQRLPSLLTEEDVRFLSELSESVRGVTVRYVFVEELPQYKDSNQKSLELKLLEALIMFETIYEEKRPRDIGPDKKETESPCIEGVQNTLKSTLITGINRRHFSLKQVWDMLIKCSIQSVCANQSIKSNIRQQHPVSYSSDYDSNDNSSTSSTSTKSSAEPGHNSDNISNAPSTHTSNARHKCTIVYSGHIISAIDIVLHYIVNQGRKTSREMNGNKISEEVLTTAQQTAVPNSNLVSEHEILYCLQNIISMIRNNRHNCLVLLRRDLIMKLLKYYLDIGSSRNIRVLILNIVVQIGVYDLRASELLCLIQLFKCEANNVEKLGADHSPSSSLYILDTLQSLVSHHIAHPEFTMKLLPPTVRYWKPYSLDLEPLSNKLSFSMMQSYDKSGMVSPWNAAAVCIPITCDLGWALWVQGISISLWYHLEEFPSLSRSNKKPYHLLSIGYEGFLIEFYADRRDLIIRLTRPERTSYELLNEQVIPKCLRYNEYDQMCLSIKDTMQSKSKRVLINVDLMLNDNTFHNVTLLFQGILIRKSRPMCILLGDKLSTSPVLSLTNLLVFRTPCLNQLLPCLLLHALGPGLNNLTECEVGNIRPDLSRLVKYCMTSRLTYTSFELMLLKQGAILRHLQEHLLLIYSSRAPTSVSLYPPALTTPTVGLLPSQPQGFFKALAQDTRPSQRFPIVKGVNIYSAAIEREQWGGLGTAIQEMAGLHSFLFLLARVVEIEASSEDQAKALDIVLKVADLLSHSIQHTEYYPLIVQVISTPRCKPSLSMLKVLFANMCGGSDEVITASREGTGALHTTHSLIYKPHILTDILLESWKYWSAECMSVLFGAVYSLIKDEHPYREFNTMQLNRVQLLDKILLVCKQMYLYDNNHEDLHSLLTPSCCQVIVEIFRALMGTPPPIEYIELILNYLLISHPPSATYVSHSRSSFYFLHSSIPSQLSEDLPAATDGKPKFSTWHGRDKCNPLAMPVDPDSLSTALRNVQTAQSYHGNSGDDHSRSTTNVDSGISGSLRENANSVENNSQIRSSLNLFTDNLGGRSSTSGLFFGSFHRNSFSQHYDNLFFKNKSGTGSSGHCYATDKGLESEDTVEEPLDCLDTSLVRSNSIDEVDSSVPWSTRPRDRGYTFPARGGVKIPAKPTEKSEDRLFNFVQREDSPSLDLRLFEFINRCRSYALSGSSDKRSPEKDASSRIGASIEELDDTVTQEEMDQMKDANDASQDVTKSSGLKSSGKASPLGQIPTPHDVLDSGKSMDKSTSSNRSDGKVEIPLSEDGNEGNAPSFENPSVDATGGSISSKGTSEKVLPEGILSQRSHEIESVLHHGFVDPSNVVNLSENLTKHENIRQLLSDLNEMKGAGSQYDGLSEHKRRSLIEIATAPSCRGLDELEELRETRSVKETGCGRDTDAVRRNDTSLFQYSHLSDLGNAHRSNARRTDAGNPSLGSQDARTNDDGSTLLETDAVETKVDVDNGVAASGNAALMKEDDKDDLAMKFGEFTEEDVENSSLSGHEMLTQSGVLKAAPANKPASPAIGTMEELFEAASKTNIMFNQTNLFQSKQEILLSALSISDVGADSDEDLESNLDDLDKILNCRNEAPSPVLEQKPQYVLNDGLIILLRDIILVLPDSMITAVFNKIITLDILLILANHQDVRIRISLMKLIYSYLQRSTEEDLAEFMYKNKGFYLLSNQISLYPPNLELANACVMFLTDCHWLPIQEQLNYIESINLSPKQMSAVPLIFSLLNISIDRFNLCLQLLRFVEKLVKKMTHHNLNKIVNEYGMVQCLLKVLIKIAHETKMHECPREAGITEHDVLLDTIDSILIHTVTRIITSTSHVSVHTQMFNNILLYLTYVENIEVATCGAGSKCYIVLKNIHRTLLEYTLDVIQDTITRNIYVTNTSVTNKIKKSLLSVLPSSSHEDQDESDDSSAPSYPASHFAPSYPASHFAPSYPASHFAPSYPSSQFVRNNLEESRASRSLSCDSSSPQYDGDVTSERYDVKYDARTDEARLRTYSLSQSMASRSIDSTMYNKQRTRKYDKVEKPAPTVKMMQKSDLIERYKTIMSKCVDYIIYSESIYPMTVSETNFICHMLVTMLLSINSVIEKKNNTNYSSIMWTIRHTLRTKTSELIIWILEPNRQPNLRIFLINTLRNEIYLKEILTNLFVNNNLEIKFILFLWELIYCCKLNNDDLRLCYEFETKLKTIINHDIGNSNSKLNREVYIACKEFRATQNEWIVSQMTHINKMILNRYEQLVKQITDTCIASTQQSSTRQNEVQKTLLSEIKGIYNKQLFTKEVWNRIILNLTHEKAPWYCEASYPKSWMLDDVEGPERVRIRQKRCHLYVHEKYLKPEYRSKTAAYPLESPLEYLVKDSIKHESMIETIHTSEKVTYMCCSHLITPSKQIQGELLITSGGLKFIPFDESHNFVTTPGDSNQKKLDENVVWNNEKIYVENEVSPPINVPLRNAGNVTVVRNQTSSYNSGKDLLKEESEYGLDDSDRKLDQTSSTLVSKKSKSDSAESKYRTDDIISVDFATIKEIHNRRYNLQEKAIELFLINGKNYLFAFENHNDREQFLNELSTCSLPSRISSDLLSDTIQLWREGHLTNWAYLMILNKMAGRSYNDLMQYPVLPFILSDYKSTSLDLTDPKSFRNLKKPMAVQDKKNEGHYINSYNYLEREMCDAVGGVNQEPYHYGSHYSNSGTVLHFLVRIPPYTSMFLNYQDNNFDLPDRTFHNLATTWRLTSSESTTDVKELIPELFYLADILVNNEGFDFGVRQNGQRVDSVILPPWAPDPRTFIMVHRQALESELVSENLPHWIDLVFGYKQSGKAAVDAINVFHPATYYGFDIAAIPDPLERTAWETMIRTYGQTPRQLFKSAHPMNVKKLTPAKESPVEVIPNIRGLVWGSYVGSPDEPPPVIVWKHKHRNPVAKLVPLKTNDVFGLAKFTTLLHSYHKDKNTNLISSLNVIGAGMICWNECDNLLRLKMSKELPAVPVIRPPLGASIVTATTAPDCHTLWLGLSCGNILVYEYELNASTNKIEFRKPPTILLGHSACVSDLYLCAAFSVAVSSSEDGTCLLWDINTIGYIRQIPSVDPTTPVSHVAMSETNGEIASVLQTGPGSILRLHTINTQLVTSLSSELKISSLTFSNAPEGVSQNVVVTGHVDGSIHLWSGYRLAPLFTLNTNVNLPVIALSYSCDSQHLYASNTEGLVIIWESSSHNRTPKFLNLTLV